jgi:hypothetical protein
MKKNQYPTNTNIHFLFFNPHRCCDFLYFLVGTFSFVKHIILATHGYQI